VVEHAVLHFGSAFATEALLGAYEDDVEEEKGRSRGRNKGKHEDEGKGGDERRAANGEGNEAEVWLLETKLYVEGNVALVVSFLQREMPQYLEVVRPHATYLVWIDCTGLIKSLGCESSPDTVHTLFVEQAQVLLSTGSEFSPETACFVRMNVACPRASVLAALHRLRDAVAAAPRRVTA
jgi:hypothetical protein